MMVRRDSINIYNKWRMEGIQKRENTLIDGYRERKREEERKTEEEERMRGKKEK